jgi:hypothetical protein
MQIKTLEQRLEILEAREAIKELRARYGWCAARGNYDGVAELFWPDGVFELLFGAERLRLEGREAIRTLLAKVMKPSTIFPLIHNDTITVDGDEANGTCAMETRSSPNSESGFIGYYHDRARRHEGTWLFAERRWFQYTPKFEDSGLDIDGRPVTKREQTKGSG